MRAARRATRVALIAVLSVGVLSAPADSQSAARTDVRAEAFTNGEIERYLRVLQLRPQARPYPWSIRAFSPGEVDRMLAGEFLHPWADRYDFSPDSVRRSVGLIAPRVSAVYNSAFPHAVEPGPAWVGRGITTVVQAGVFARLGPLSATLAPVAYRAANAPFELMPVPRAPHEYADPVRPFHIDRPQRFGSAPLTRLDPGESRIRLDAGPLAAGISTAGQQWGPAVEYPLVLGTNAGGYPHAFAGTSRPLSVWLARLHGRMVWGRLDQSAYSPVQEGEPRRFMTGVVATASPRGVHGLEVGLSRFYHLTWPAAGPGTAEVLRPLESFLKVGIRGEDPDARPENQLASAFFRWVFPASRLEVFGEFMREDHSHDLRHLLGEPDDLSGYTMGLQKVWAPGTRRHTSVRAEVMNAQTPHRGRNVFGNTEFVPLYTHASVRQGHTHRGRLLVPDAAYGGAGSVIALDVYHPGGRVTVDWRREQRRARSAAAPAADVLHALGLEALLFARGLELEAGAAGVYNLNRDFGGDAFNLNLRLQVRGAL
jgi:hypothetical protein